MMLEYDYLGLDRGWECVFRLIQTLEVTFILRKKMVKIVLYKP